jgi:hypothetical protein
MKRKFLIMTLCFSVFILLTACQPKDPNDKILMDNQEGLEYKNIGHIGDVRHVNVFGGVPTMSTKEKAIEYWKSWIAGDTEGMDEASDGTVDAGFKVRIIDRTKGMCKVRILNTEDLEDPENTETVFWVICDVFGDKDN